MKEKKTITMHDIRAFIGGLIEHEVSSTLLHHNFSLRIDSDKHDNLHKDIFQETQFNNDVCYGHGGWQDSNASFLAYCIQTKTAYCICCSKTQGLEKQYLARPNYQFATQQHTDRQLVQENTRNNNNLQLP